MRTADDLRRAAVDAARDARGLLAELAPIRDPALAAAIPDVVAALFATEIGDAAKVLGALTSAAERLRALLDACDPGTPVAAALSRALALLHPVHRELARTLDPKKSERRDDTQPFLLTPARVKPSVPPPGEEERRDELRLELEVDVGLEGDNTFYTGRTGDLSKGGLFVASDEPFPVGTDLLLSFVLPDGYRVCADGVVAWVRAPRYRPDELPAGMGIRFLHLSTKDERAIAHFLAQRPAFRYGD